MCKYVTKNTCPYKHLYESNGSVGCFNVVLKREGCFEGLQAFSVSLAALCTLHCSYCMFSSLRVGMYLALSFSLSLSISLPFHVPFQKQPFQLDYSIRGNGTPNVSCNISNKNHWNDQQLHLRKTTAVSGKPAFLHT